LGGCGSKPGADRNGGGVGPRSGSSVTEPKAAGPSPGAELPTLDADVL
jgi:hypothetical protein